jgi:hypothetical protein
VEQLSDTSHHGQYIAGAARYRPYWAEKGVLFRCRGISRPLAPKSIAPALLT